MGTAGPCLSSLSLALSRSSSPPADPVGQQQPWAHHWTSVQPRQASSSTLAAGCAGLLTARWVSSPNQLPTGPHSNNRLGLFLKYIPSSTAQSGPASLIELGLPNLFSPTMQGLSGENPRLGREFRREQGETHVEPASRHDPGTPGNRCYLLSDLFPQLPGALTLQHLSSDPSSSADTLPSSALWFPLILVLIPHGSSPERGHTPVVGSSL